MALLFLVDVIAGFPFGRGPFIAFDILGLIASPILGGEGNREFLIGARRG
jgi:hypothetical protein